MAALPKLLLYKTSPTSWLLLLLLSALLILPTTRSLDTGGGDYGYDDGDENYDYADEYSDEYGNDEYGNDAYSGDVETSILNLVKSNMILIKEDILACCNGTNTQFKEDLHSQKEKLLEKLSKVAEKSDMEDIVAIIKKLANESDERYLTEVVGALPNQTVLPNLIENPYSENHLWIIKNTYQSLFTTVMDQMTNSSSTLQDDLDKMKEEIDSLMTFQNNVTKTMNKIDGLPTQESFQNITNEFTGMATKEDVQSAEEQIMNLNQKLQESLSADNLKLKDLLTQEDVKGLIPIFYNIISQQDLENLNKHIKLLSSENSVNYLFKKMDLLAKKDDLEQMGNVFVSNNAVFKNDLENVLGQMLGVANKTVVEALENDINALKEGIDEYLDQLLELKDIIITLLQDLEKQDEQLNTLDLHINKLSGSEALINLKNILLATYSTTNTSLEYVKGQEGMMSSTTLTVTNPPNDCLHKTVIEETMADLQNDIDSLCNNDKLQDSVLSLETKLLHKIGNISLVIPNKKDCQTPSTIQITPKTEASPCMDSSFKGSPKDVNVCSVIVFNYMCSADPLLGFHCCRSCIRAKQITKDGPHRYVRAPRKLDYNSVRYILKLEN